MKSKSQIDVKSIGIPNICFSLTNDDDRREAKFKKQRQKRGFDDSETWSLDYTIACFLIPRLKRFIELYSENIKDRDDSIKKFKKFLKALYLIKKNSNDVLSKKELKIMEEGLALFPEICNKLWW